MISRWLADATARGGADAESRALTVFPEVAKFLSRPGLNLSGGQKKMVSIARAMTLAPSLMILDEAFEGLAPVVVKRFRDAVMMTAGRHFAPARGIKPDQRGRHRRPALRDRSRRDHLPRHPEGGARQRERHADAARVIGYRGDRVASARHRRPARRVCRCP